MVAIKETPYKIKVHTFQAGTPAIDLESANLVDSYYNNDFFEKFLKLIISNRNNKHKNGTNYFHLVSLKQSSDADVLEGKIHTTKYGVLSDIIDTDTDIIVNRVEPVQGVRNEINFVINKNNGLFLIQNDPFRIVSRNFLFDFLKEREPLALNLVKQFNLDNLSHSLFEKFSFTFVTVHDKGFYEQLAKIHNIKSISVNTTVERPAVNSALNRFTKEGVSEEDLLADVTDIMYTFKNTKRSDGIKRVENFVENALDLEKIDSIVAEGQNLKAEFKIKPQSYQIKTSKNKHGILDQSKIINQMIELVKTL
ncbi:hypothetical protein [Planococcus versutus]|uniref:Uncharacterized protein n=1 Tax=Planococcus versutus TaxID=1302659 RepID=A0A1B1S5E2_9BACL|nr:hypothetical protein [Planococcus versutus]ANU28412.1 hypothetical protein I858_015590 [Planococcus versutus]